MYWVLKSFVLPCVNLRFRPGAKVGQILWTPALTSTVESKLELESVGVDHFDWTVKLDCFDWTVKLDSQNGLLQPTPTPVLTLTLQPCLVSYYSSLFARRYMLKAFLWHFDWHFHSVGQSASCKKVKKVPDLPSDTKLSFLEKNT